MNWRALSIVQPWAWLILRPDLREPAARAAARARREIKDVENRGWSSDVRGWVLVHASASKLAKWDWAKAALFAAKRGVELPLQGELPRGAFVGAMRIDGCEPCVRSPWFTGEGWGYRLGASAPWPVPVAGIGRLGFFDPGALVDIEVAGKLRARIAEQLRAVGLAAEFGLSPGVPGEGNTLREGSRCNPHGAVSAPPADDAKRDDPATPGAIFP